MSGSPVRALVCTIGGSTDPVVRAIEHWEPARVWFIASRGSRATIDQVIQTARIDGLPLCEGARDVLELSDHESLQACIRELHDHETEVLRWVSDDGTRSLIVDLTCGTKPMSAALGLVASRWPCTFSYVGGTERNKGGLGVVELGTENVVETMNPWDELGFRAIDEAAVLFDRRAYAAAADLLKTTKLRLTDPQGKTVLATFETLAGAYDAWERFDHGKAKGQIDRALERDRDFRALTDQPHRERRLLEVVKVHSRWLGRIPAKDGPERRGLLVLDLLANAKRRAEEGRYDDAVARLYRALEAAAQARLAAAHGIASTASVPVEKIPESLRSQWTESGQETVELGLQNAYRLLSALADGLGRRFEDSGLGDAQRSPLNLRNQSILAHGFRSIGEKHHDQLREKVESVIEPAETPPEFPRLRRDG